MFRYHTSLLLTKDCTAAKHINTPKIVILITDIGNIILHILNYTLERNITIILKLEASYSA